MSQDIRSFFGGRSKPKSGSNIGTSKTNGKGKRKYVDDDDDDDADFAATAQKQQRNITKPAKMKKSNIIFDSDSEEEAKPVTPKRKQNGGAKPAKKSRQALASPSPPKTKTTTVLDFFGNSPVHRSAKKSATPSNKQASNGSSKKPRLDLEEHDDEDFQETLRAMDEESAGQKQKPVKTTSLAGKLSAKIKGERRVPETPDRDKPKATDRRSEPVIKDTPTGSRQQSRVESTNRDSSTSRSTPTKSTPSKSTSRPSTRSTPTKTPPKTKVEAASPPPKAREVHKSPPKAKEVHKSTPKARADTQTSPPSGDGEKKKGNPNYRSYLNRDGPRSLGAREEPQGADACLEGLTLVVTGVLEYFDKDEIKAMVEKYGGRVTGSVSKKTTHLVIGRDPGESKVAKAQSFGTKQIQEDDLYEMIETRPGKGKPKVKGQTPQKTAQVTAVKQEKKVQDEKPKSSSSSSLPKTEIKKEPSIASNSSTSKTLPSSSSSAPKASSSLFSQVSQSGQSSKPAAPASQSNVATEMWVDKYKPTVTKGIIGQQGDRSNAKKLTKWLQRWQDNNYGANKERAKFNRDDGFAFKAALLSGPPGVGKTTTATLVCKENDFTFMEMNASDSRNKKTLQGGMAEFLDSRSINDMWKKGGTRTHRDTNARHCLIMDEVDGVAGNEDRGGIQELIQMIKNTRVPVICICNDRSHPKMRSLVHHCFDLRFQRPRVPQIKAAMMSIAFKEGVSIPPASLDGMIMAANQDVRQVLHNLSMWTAGQKKLSAEQIEVDAKNAKKDLKMGPWDVVRQVFSSKDQKKMNFHQKMDLFFHDYSIAPLFVQENYLSVMPDNGRGDIKKHLDLISKAADSLCLSDLVEKTIRSRSQWRLLPTQAVFASVIPGVTLQGYMGHMINFPSWLGKNSTRGKNFRLLQELQVHMRRSTSASIQDLNQLYLPHLRKFLTDPLIQRETEGVPDTVQLMCDYDLLREDFDSLLEVTQYTGFKQPMSNVPTKVKSAFTRKFNQSSHLNPYSVDAGKKKKGKGGGGGGGEGALLGEEGEEEATQEDEESDEDVSSLQVKKKASSSAGSKGKGQAKGKAQPKGKGRGKGKSK